MVFDPLAVATSLPPFAAFVLAKAGRHQSSVGQQIGPGIQFVQGGVEGLQLVEQVVFPVVVDQPVGSFIQFFAGVK